jgi:Uma2 family endonuclease
MSESTETIQPPAAPVPPPPEPAVPDPTDPTPIFEEMRKVTAQLGRVSDPEPVFRKLRELTQRLPDSDGEPLETPWHYASIHLLLFSLTYYWRHREDFFIGGNMFVYFSMERVFHKDFRGPDFFYVEGVPRRRPRRFWAVWEEGGKYPDVIVEFLSESTAETDLTVKKDLYQNTFHLGEYFCFDPDTGRFQGWRLVGGQFQDIQPDSHGWMWSEKLQLWLGTWQGTYMDLQRTWLRFYDSDGNLVPLAEEAVERQADLERERAEAERRRAEEEHRRAEAERQRAETAEAEIARLRALLAQQGSPPDTPQTPS